MEPLSTDELSKFNEVGCVFVYDLQPVTQQYSVIAIFHLFALPTLIMTLLEKLPLSEYGQCHTIVCNLFGLCENIRRSAVAEIFGSARLTQSKALTSHFPQSVV